MSKKTAVVDVVARNILTNAGKTAKPIPMASSGMAPQMPLMLLDGLMQLKQAHADYQRLREEEKTKRENIRAERDVTIEQIRAQRDIIKQAFSESYELRKTGLQAQIQAMDKAIDSGNTEALHTVLDAMVTTIQSSPFKDIADMKEQLAKNDFVLRLK